MKMKLNYILFSTLLIGTFISCESSKEVSTNTTSEETRPSKPMAKQTIDFTYIDKSVRPQDDFFLFANGNWVKNNPVPPSESRWGSFNELERQNNTKLLAILNDASKAKPLKGSTEQLLSAYYQSYINMNKRNELGVEPISDDLALIDKMISKDQLPEILALMHKKGVPAFFGFGVGQDLKNVDKHITYLSQGGLGLPNKDYYTKEDKKELLEKYRQHIAEMHYIVTLVKIGESIDNFEGIEADAENQREGKVVLSIEKKLAESMMAPAELRIPENTYNKMSKKELLSVTPNFDWETYFREVGSLSFDSLVVGQPDYIKYFGNLIEEENFYAIKTYLKWKVINHYAGHLSSPFVQAHFNFYGTELSGTKEMKPIEERAIKEITGNPLGELLGKAFVERHYSAEAQRKVNELVDNLLIVFQERINNLDWMSKETKAEALNKLNSIGRKLGFPEKWEDLSMLNLTEEGYISNINEIALYENNKNFNELKEPVDKEEWGMPAHMVNAYYHPLLNEIAFPAGIMQPPFFSEHYEDAVNYGRIGMVIGHEFTHGFDDMGSKFAADGSFKNWWTEEDRKLFEDRTTILGNTFEGFCPVDGQCVNPQLTMGENIADLGGLTLAYYAYARTSDFKSGEKIEGFTPAQRFFLAYAQLWKINYTEAELKKRLATDPHSPGMYRVNGPLMNCPEFFKAFEVSEGDPMRNKESKVAKIW